MSFLSAAFLWALPLAAAPVIIHLFNRRRRDVIRWAAMRFLIEHATRRRRLWRVDDLILMLLRAAVLIALVLALARPQIVSAWFGTGAGRDVILVLDTSMSTARRLGDQTSFDRILDRAEQTIDDLTEQDSVRIMQASTAPSWLTPVAMFGQSDAKRRIVRQLDELEPTRARADLLAAIQLAVEAETSDPTAGRLIVVLTDGQAISWRTDQTEAWRRVSQSITSLPQGAVVNVIDVADDAGGAANLAVQKLDAVRTLVGVGAQLSLNVTVRNGGELPTGPGIVRWHLDDQELGLSAVGPLEAGQTTSVGTEHLFTEPGVFVMRCDVEAQDDLSLDNVGHLIVEVVDQVPVLIVEQQGQAGLVETDTAYLLAALGHADSPDASAEWQSVFKPHVIDIYQLDQQSLDDFYCIVLANVLPTEPTVVDKLRAFVRQGGGLWIALGDRTQAATFNDLFHADGEGLAPLPIGQVRGDPDDRDQFVGIVPPTMIHPATQLISDTERLDLDEAKIYCRHVMDSSAAGEGLSALLVAEGGEPLVVERWFGRGRVIVQAVPLDIRWSNLPLCHAFVPMVHEWLWYLIQPAATPRNVQIGDPLVLKLNNDAADETVQVKGPVGEPVELEATVDGDNRAYRFGETLVPGIYRFVVERADRSTTTWPYHVRCDPAESDLAPLRDQDRAELETSAGIHFVSDPLAYEATAEPQPLPKPIGMWLLAALVALILAELLAAAGMTWRRQRPGPGPAPFAEPE